MRISHLRWIVLIVAFLALTYGGLAGLSLGNFLPTFSCRYVDTRGGECFLWSQQHHFSGHGGPGYLVRLSRPIFLYFCLLIIVIGKAWCGWICPFGFFMDVLDLIRRKLHIGYITFSEKLRARLAPIKWIFLFITLLVPLST
ncbi:MAG: 4Fe-4S binding protein, partial [Candidatus Omnitrophica bacterium]|nr:4Fe-4S binding protein [Candidatus Omnitrophota bacterium]